MKSAQFLKLVSRFALALGVFAFAFAFSATTRAAVAENAFVRVVHASPEAGNVDVYVDGNKLLTDFKFSTVTDYVAVPAGAHKIQVAPAGKGADAAVITQDVSVNAGVPYTVAAIGTKADGFGLQAFGDNNLVTPGTAKVRVYHLSPNAGPVNIAAGGKTVITALTYKNASDYLTIPGGDYTFDVTATDAGATVPVKATIKPHTVNSVFAVGLFKGEPALTFVAASANGVPESLPNTGSNPNIETSNTSMPWLFAALGLTLVGAGAFAGRVALSRKK